MKLQHIQTSDFMSQAVVFGDTIFLAGMTADTAHISVAEQTKQILSKIDAVLTEAGSDKSRLLYANIWMRDVSLWGEMNAEWSSWLEGVTPPARATVQSAMVLEGYDVEIMVTAAKM